MMRELLQEYTKLMFNINSKKNTCIHNTNIPDIKKHISQKLNKEYV